MSDEKNLEINRVWGKLIKDGIIEDFGFCNCLYHGTKKYYAQQIINTKKIRDADRGHLGSGFYCYFLEPNCSKIWARNKFKGEKIAILVLKANLGNVFYINEKRYNIFKDFAEKKIKDYDPDINITVGYVVEKVIKEFIKNKFDIDIDTVCKYRVFSNIQVLVFSLRKQRIKKIDIWEQE